MSVTPGSMISSIGLLQSKVKDIIGAMEERVVDIGPDEVRSSSHVSIFYLVRGLISMTQNFNLKA